MRSPVCPAVPKLPLGLVLSLKSKVVARHQEVGLLHATTFPVGTYVTVLPTDLILLNLCGQMEGH